MQVNISPIVLEDKVIGTVILVRDITEERVLERSKDELFSIASHELRTPLTSIRSYASLINNKYKNDIKNDKLKTMVEGIHHSAIRLIDIVNDFLDTSRLEQRRILFKNEDFDLALVVKQVTDDFAALAKEKKLKLTTHKAPPHLPKAYADVERVKQILINLIGNAIKFTDSGEVTVELFRDGDSVGVRILDTGKGILEENKTLLFRKFQQAGHDIITRDASRGTGLGLYISKLLVEGMGGKIWLEHSEVGKGSVFAFSVPTMPPKK